MSKFTCERCDARYGANELHECGDARADALDDERRAAVAALREVCARHGDNDWPDDLHLADVIEKHLARHLERKADVHLPELGVARITVRDVREVVT